MSQARARDLVFALYQRGLHPELLPVARSQSASREAFQARLLLLEPGGHALVFAASKDPQAPVLVEAVVPTALELPRTGRVELRPIVRAMRDKVRSRGAILYECGYALETCAASEFSRRHEKILAATPQGERLLFDRGHPENAGPAPFSLVDFELKDRALDAFFVHAFPNERAFVFVKSSFAVAQ